MKGALMRTNVRSYNYWWYLRAKISNFFRKLEVKFPKLKKLFNFLSPKTDLMEEKFPVTGKGEVSVYVQYGIIFLVKEETNEVITIKPNVKNHGVVLSLYDRDGYRVVGNCISFNWFKKNLITQRRRLDKGTGYKPPRKPRKKQ